MSLERERLRPGVNAYIVPAFDRSALLFSFPVRISRDLGGGGSHQGGMDGAVAVAIEAIKAAATEPGASIRLDPLAGRGTAYPNRYGTAVEPYTLIASPKAIGAGLFRAGSGNQADPGGISLVLTGALPHSSPESPAAVRGVKESLAALAVAVGEVVRGIPDRALEAGRIASLDQKSLRESLPSLGLVALVGDGSRPARTYTRLRCHYRVAGPMHDGHVPFRCPPGLDPVEVELPASGRTLTGLGIRRGEVIAIAGSNAEGKSTLLSAILSGVDDHLPGDGREGIVTVHDPVFAEAGSHAHHADDLSLFFGRLPPGLSGTPRSASGPGSGSTTMAEQISRAVSRRAPLLAFDEDRSAVNLLVPSSLTAPGVTPLSTILATDRKRLRDTAVVFTAGALDLLVAEADRILVLEGFRAGSVSRREFRRRLTGSLKDVVARLELDDP